MRAKSEQLPRFLGYCWGVSEALVESTTNMLLYETAPGYPRLETNLRTASTHD